MNERDYSPTIKNPLIKAFLDKFSGSFMISIYGSVYYSDINNKWYTTSETKTEFFDTISNSLKQGEDLFLNYPKKPVSESVIED
jgi:hypothetical protein